MAHSERLAQMYLLKMRHPEFNSNAGAVWRQLFVLAMLPWMRKYRVFSEERKSQAIETLALHKLEVKEDAKGLVELFGEDVEGMMPTAAAAEAVSTGAETGARFVVDTAAEAGRLFSRGTGSLETTITTPLATTAQQHDITMSSMYGNSYDK